MNSVLPWYPAQSFPRSVAEGLSHGFSGIRVIRRKDPGCENTCRRLIKLQSFMHIFRVPLAQSKLRAYARNGTEVYSALYAPAAL